MTRVEHLNITIPGDAALEFLSVVAPEETYRKRSYFFDDAVFEWELTEDLTADLDDMYLYAR